MTKVDKGNYKSSDIGVYDPNLGSVTEHDGSNANNNSESIVGL